jgi:hypothetical protein
MASIIPAGTRWHAKFVGVDSRRRHGRSTRTLAPKWALQVEHAIDAGGFHDNGVTSERASTTDRGYRQHVHKTWIPREGTTRTPFDLLVCNQMNRDDLALDVIHRAGMTLIDTRLATVHWETVLARHRSYIHAHGEDRPEVVDCRLPAPRQDAATAEVAMAR